MNWVVRKVVEFDNEEECRNLIEDLVDRAYDLFCDGEYEKAFPIIKAAVKLIHAEDVEVKIE